MAEHHGKHQLRFYGPDDRERSKSFAKITKAKKFKAAMTADKDRGVWGDPRNAKAPFEVVAKAHLARKDQAPASHRGEVRVLPPVLSPARLRSYARRRDHEGLVKVVKRARPGWTRARDGEGSLPAHGRDHEAGGGERPHSEVAVWWRRATPRRSRGAEVPR